MYYKKSIDKNHFQIKTKTFQSNKMESFQQNGDKSGKMWENLITFVTILMIQLIGTYECKVDAKGRIALPAAFKKQLAAVLTEPFVIKRSIFQNCLEIHPMSEWNEVMTKVNTLNRFVKKNNDFIRMFTAGVKVVEVDANSRFQISKDLIEFAGIEKNVVLSSSLNMIEIWNKESYEIAVNPDNVEFAALAEEVMGNEKEDELS